MRNVWLVVLGSLVTGCGGEDRPVTAPPLPVPILDASCSEYDHGADGSVDIVYTFTYDADGFMTKYVGSSGDVGEYTYDRDHFVLRFTESYDSDPEPEYEETYTRDRFGRVLTSRYEDFDSYVETGAYEYDGDGRVVRATTTSNGTTQETTYVYQGRRLNPTSGRTTYPDGASSIVYTSSPDERMLRAEIDDGEDGIVDRTIEVTYDDKRRIIARTGRANGAVYVREEVVYNGDGHVTSWIVADNEGPADLEFYALFDARGLQMERGMKSPSGAYANSVYREVDKEVCAQARTSTPLPGVRPVWLRPSTRELPPAFGAF